MNESWLIWGLLFGSIGLGYVIYGRRQKNIVPFLSGLALIAFPYFVPNTFALIAIGILLILIPFFIKI
jgi:hypothetical protein